MMRWFRRPRRVLILLPSGGMGGTERHTAGVATRLAAQGVRVTLAVDEALLAPMRPLLGPGVVMRPAAVVWNTRQPPEVTHAHQAAATEALLRWAKPDVTMVPLPWPDAGVGLLAALAAAGAPRLVLAHLGGDGRAFPTVAAALPGLDAVRAVFGAVSTPVARRIAPVFGLDAAAVTVVPNPAPAIVTRDRATARVTARAQLGLPPDAPLLLFVGRLEHAKGAELLPSIAALLPATIAVAGEGRLRGELEAAAAADPRRALRLLGHVEDMPSWYHAADAMLLPSRLEGEPLVMLEAAAYRCPVIATEAALEALGPRMHQVARIAAPEAAALAEGARAVLADSALRASLTEAAAAYAAAQSWDRTMAGILALLRAAMARR